MMVLGLVMMMMTLPQTLLLLEFKLYLSYLGEIGDDGGGGVGDDDDGTATKNHYFWNSN